VSPWIKKKPKSHLGILKEEKDQKSIQFFPREIERLRESKRRESFYFSEKRKQQRRGTNSKAKLGHGFRGNQQKKRIRTIRIWYGRIYCTCSGRTAAQKPRKTGAFNSPYGLYGRRTAAFNFGHIFQQNRTTFNAVTVRTVRLSKHRFRGGCWVSSSQFQARKSRKR
jgi:hypothetical protein